MIVTMIFPFQNVSYVGDVKFNSHDKNGASVPDCKEKK